MYHGLVGRAQGLRAGRMMKTWAQVLTPGGSREAMLRDYELKG